MAKLALDCVLDVTPTFDRTTKKLHRQQKADLDDAVRAVACDTTVGEAKVGDLAGIQVYKFKMASQLCLLAYRVLDEKTVKLLMVGPFRRFIASEAGYARRP